MWPASACWDRADGLAADSGRALRARGLQARGHRAADADHPGGGGAAAHRAGGQAGAGGRSGSRGARRRDPAELASVFSSSGGDGDNCHELCQALTLDGREISPTRFANSVHNIAAGYWSIGTGAMTKSNVLCAFDASFGAGLLEAMTQVAVDQEALLLVSYDTAYPLPLHARAADTRCLRHCAGPHSGQMRELAGTDAGFAHRRAPANAGESGLGVSAPRDPGGPQSAAAAPVGGRAAGSVPSSIYSRRASRAAVQVERMQLDRAWIAAAHSPPRHDVPARRGHRVGRGAHRCRTGTHRAADNPLRSAGRLGAACGIEYAAQTMAVHGALASSASQAVRAEAGFLSGDLRDVRLHVLGSMISRTIWSAMPLRVAGDGSTALYEFGMWAGTRSLLSGRATVLRGREHDGRMNRGRRALVTGGSGGIGSGHLPPPRRRGLDRVRACEPRRAAAQGIAGEIVAGGGQAQAVGFDVTDATRGAAIALDAARQGPIQVLVNSAGVIDDAVFPGMSPRNGPRDRRVAQRLLQRHPALDAADDSHALGPTS
jgi:predicted hotdog family 3-hydroxylacyl-ACP dehydratase